MNDKILQHWHFEAKANGSSLIIPDGCRDLIFMAPAGQKPYWQITSLDQTAHEVRSAAGDFFMGYRLRPGISIEQKLLLDAIINIEPGQGTFEYKIESAMEKFCFRSKQVEQALACFSSGHTNVILVALDIGIGLRSLQRLILQQTGKTASFWIGLVRARRTARELGMGSDLAQAAYDFGYSDQSHMNRDIRRWFGISPGEIKYQPRIVAQLNQTGFN